MTNRWWDRNGNAHDEPYTGPMKGQHAVVPRPEPKSRECPACDKWNHWHDTPDGTCEDPQCECAYRPKDHRD